MRVSPVVSPAHRGTRRLIAPLSPELAAVHDVLDAPLALRTVLHSAQIHMPPDLEDLCIDLLHLAPSDRPTAVKAVHRALGTSEGRADRRDRLCAALRATFAPNRGT